jgi:hypothetical protein
MKTTHKSEKVIPECPCCGQPTTKQFDITITKCPPIAYLLRQQFKRRRSKPLGRDWRVDPRPRDSIAILDRAYYERAKSAKRMNVPSFRHVVRVSRNRVYYRREDDEPVRSCSRSTWRRLDADLVGRAIEKGGKINELRR